MMEVTVAMISLTGIRSDLSSNAYLLYDLSQESFLSMDPAQNNHDSKNVCQHQVHIID